MLRNVKSFKKVKKNENNLQKVWRIGKIPLSLHYQTNIKKHKQNLPLWQSYQ